MISTTTNSSANTSSYLQLMCHGTECELQNTSKCNQTIGVSCRPSPGTRCTTQQNLFTSTRVQYITTTAHVCPTTCTCSTALPSDRTIVITRTRNHTIRDHNDCESSTSNTLATPSTPTNQIDGTVGGLATFTTVQFLALIAVTLGWVCTCVQIKLKRSGKYTVTYVKSYIVFA